MKATKLLLATTLFTGLATLSFAGPGPDYRARLQKIQKEQALAKAPAAAPVAVCANCNCPAMKKS